MTENETHSEPSATRAADRSYSKDIEWREIVRGQRPGDVAVRLGRHRSFRGAPGGLLVPRPETLEPQGGLPRVWWRAKRLLIGRPIATELESHERLTKLKALAVFSSDALSSVAYATEEIMKVLVLAGTGALALTLPIALVIGLLLLIVVVSYQQTIRAYPGGGGSYIVASDNLGTLPGLTAAAALLTDYVLTVAVSVAAGVFALTSLFPELLDFRVEIAVGAVLLLTLANLRGVRESGSILAVPTYVFIASILGLIGYGLFRIVTGTVPPYVPPEAAAAIANRANEAPQALGLFLILSAFAQGCTALTGVEAVSNGVPAFKAPEWVNARKTLIAMGVILGVMFLGISFIVAQVGIQPAGDQESVISQLTRTLTGQGAFWWIVQLSTALILMLAANTSFADFPRLNAILARDNFLPHNFADRGDRLTFSVGIVVLAIMAIGLLIAFNGSLDALIPLYAVGVFTAFTLSQSGMVVHWWRQRGRGWEVRLAINGLGATATGIVTVVIGLTKFIHGAWLIILIVPVIILLFLAIHRHYQRAATALAAETPIDPEAIALRMIVPIAGLNLPARQALAYAQAISDNVTAVHVTDEPKEGHALREKWEALHCEPRLVIIESPYRSLVSPLLAYVDAVRESHPDETINVVLPEFVPSRWWENLLHRQTALRLKYALLFRPGIIVTSVPYHLERQKAAAKPSASDEE